MKSLIFASIEKLVKSQKTNSMNIDEFIFSQLQDLQRFEEWWRTLPDSDAQSATEFANNWIANAKPHRAKTWITSAADMQESLWKRTGSQGHLEAAMTLRLRAMDIAA